jgi:hypothetical protein
MPDPKDAVAVKNFIKAKYQDKKYLAKQEKESKKKDKEKEKEQEKDSKKKEESESSDSSPEKDKKKPSKNADKLAPLNVRKDKEAKEIKPEVLNEPKSSTMTSTGGPQLKKLNLGNKQNGNEEKHPKTQENINDMLEKFEFFEDNNSNNNNHQTNNNSGTKQQQNSGIDINSIFGNSNIFETPQTQTQPQPSNPGNNFNFPNQTNNTQKQQPQQNQQPKKPDLNIDQLFNDYNHQQQQNPGFNFQQQQQFNPQMNQQFNPQMNQQFNPQMNPQLMQMIMSNPQLLYQFMQQFQQQQGGFQQQQMPGFNPMMMGNQGQQQQMPTNFPSVIMPQESKPVDDEKKDLFKDIYSYSETKKKNVTFLLKKTQQTQQKVENNFNPFV